MKKIVIVVETVLIVAFVIGLIFSVRKTISFREESNSLRGELNEWLAMACEMEGGNFQVVSIWDPIIRESRPKGICLGKMEGLGQDAVRFDFGFYALPEGTILAIQDESSSLPSYLFIRFPLPLEEKEIIGQGPYTTVFLLPGHSYQVIIRKTGGEDFYLAGTIHITGMDIQYQRIWFWEDPSGTFYLCDAVEGVFPDFWVEGAKCPI